ncbi:tRNA adenosine(34) deaminase TadA [Acinetobacter sp. 194]|uniref:tRNA adenosine(34) deaminase TadA n=1 Tax=Acinetobacter shaoyimingii TaxID=2715164 RepID=UPI001407CF31|nr:tRNA adenosine(34) deaminase TadA [Acinetobacter shaoyimingii]NHB57222.1 tRNA adenosine(34) deaminase TadA [Acinetobacter shaoyimingii]
MTESFNTDDEKWMQLAYAQAALAADMDEIPVGAVIVSGGQVIGQGFNQPITGHDPTAHAEIVAIRQACQNINNYRLPEDATLYVTLEPCTMCVGALVHARIRRVVFATTEPKAGSLISARQLLSNNGYYNHVFEFASGCLQEQCSQQLSNFFKKRREEKRQLRLQQKIENESSKN